MKLDTRRRAVPDYEREISIWDDEEEKERKQPSLERLKQPSTGMGKHHTTSLLYLLVFKVSHSIQIQNEKGQTQHIYIFIEYV